MDVDRIEFGEVFCGFIGTSVKNSRINSSPVVLTLSLWPDARFADKDLTLPIFFYPFKSLVNVVKQNSTFPHR